MNRNSQIISIGVDPGTKNGAIAIVDDSLNIIYLAKAPYFSVNTSKKVKPKLNKETGKYETAYRQRSWTDFKALREIVLPYTIANVIYTIEKASVRPLEGASTAFVNGNSMGVYQGLYALLQPIEYYEPTPQSWKKELGVTSDKDSSVKLAEETYKCSLRTFLKRGKLDDIAEALLIAFYGLRQHYIKENKSNGDS